MKNNQNKFQKVSAFSPNISLKYRWNSLLFVIFAEMGSVIWLENLLLISILNENKGVVFNG